MKRPASIQIFWDGEHARVIQSGENRDISLAVEEAAFTDPIFRAACIVAVVGMFEVKNSDLAVAILQGLEVEPPTQAGKAAQIAAIKKVLAA